MEQRFGQFDLVGFDERLAGRHALRFEERVGHRTADQHGVALGQQVLNHRDFVGDLGATEDHHEGPLGTLRRLGQVVDFLLQQVARRAVREHLGHAIDRRVRAVRGTEGIVHVHVTEVLELFAERLFVLLLAGVISEVLQQTDLAVLQRANDLLGFVADTVGGEGHGRTEMLGQPFGNGLQRVLWIRLAIRPAEVAAEHQASATRQEVLDGRQCRNNARIVADRARGLVDRHIEVHTAKHALAFDVKVPDAADGHGRSPPPPKSG